MGSATMVNRADIVIAGGGVAGLALALALKKARGKTLSVSLHDPAFANPAFAPKAGPDRRAYAVAAGARRMLETLGVWKDIAHTAQPLLAMDIPNIPNIPK